MRNRLVKSFVAGLASFAGIAGAQVTRMAIETSLDGVTWAGGTRAVPAGTTVQFRCVVTFDPAGTTQSTVGFASLTFQPTLSNWTTSDALAAFATVGNNTNGGSVPDSPGQYGRISPFAATGPTTSDPYRVHLQSNASINYARLARTTITNWIGVGPTSGTAAANNFNGAGGVACVQKSFGSVGPSDPPFNSNVSGVVLAKFAFTLSSDTTARQLQITVPNDGMSRNATTGAREASWYASNSDLLGSVKTSVVVSPAVVEVCQPPVAAVQPLPVLAHAGASTTFSFSATAPGAIAYRWRRNGAPLVDDARVSGAGTRQLTISNLTSGDVGSYDCVATGSCLSVTSTAVPLTLTPCAPAWLAGGSGGFGARWIHAQAYSGINSGTLLYGGRTAANTVASDTWLRVGSSWNQVATTGPGPRNDHAMAPSQGGKVLLFGGQTGVPGSPSTILGDTWEWSGTAWTQVASTGPTARIGAAMTFDSVRNRVVLFGGMAADGSLLDDLWEWDGTAWSQPVASVRPQPRFATAMAFDPVRGRSVMFGGYQYATGYLRDTWEWDGSAWAQVASTGPAARYYHSLAYNPRQGGVVLYGGSINVSTFSDAAVWNGLAWVACTATGTPSPRWALAGSFDPDAGRMIYTGGGGNGGRDTPYSEATSIADALFVATQPVASVSPCEGSAAIGLLSFGVSAPSAITYQWRKGGVDVPGATSALLSFNPVSAANAGTYTCIATSSCGSIESSPSTVIVQTRPVFTQQPASVTSCSGLPVSLTAVATGSGPITYQWSKGGVPLDGATSSTLSIGTLTASNAGTYACTATGPCGSVVSSSVDITVQLAPFIATQPSSASVCQAQPAALTVVAGGTGPFSYVWKRNGTVVSGATSATITFASVTVANAGNYVCEVTGTCGTVASNVATLSVNVGPSVTTQPSNVSVCASAAASFAVTATGTGTLAYQWRKGGVNISGATSSSYSVASASSGDAGSYDCVVTNACGSVTSSAATLTVNTAPSITTQPAASTSCVGSGASFTVAATGTSPLTYQWRRGGVNISGATSATYSIASVVAGSAGSYDCVVTNACGSVTSSAVTLTVNTPASITTQPAATTSCVGSGASFTVAATGTSPLTYQWRKGGSNISGATSATYSIASVVAGSAGSYDCVVTNTCGSVTTSTATLTVNTLPIWTTQPSSISVAEGQSATLTAAASGSAPLTFQWRKNGVAIPGATAASFTVTSVVASDAGSYTCVATNACGSASSNAAELFITQSTVTAAARCVPVQLFDAAGLAGDRLGSVSMSGDTVVVGADLRDVGSNVDQGYAIVFRRTSTGYVREATLVDPAGVAGDNFGNATAIVGNTAVVGAWLATVDGRASQGAVYVYVRSGGSWVQQARLLASDGAAGDSFGVSIAFDGDTIAVGSYQDDIGAAADQGSVYVFTRSGSTWTQQAKLLASDGAAGDTFGNAVHLRGDSLIVGAPTDTTPAGALAGSAYVFTRSGATWTQQARLAASDGRGADFFGSGVAIEGDTAIVGAFFADIGSSVNQGAAYVYRRSGTSWTQESKLVAPDGAAGDAFGISVALRNGTVAIGSFFDDVATAADGGSVYLFSRGAGSWTHQARLEMPGGGAGVNDQFGFPIALTDDAVLVGAVLDDVGGKVDAGSAWIFSKVAGAWLVGDLQMPLNGESDDAFGASIAIAGDTMAIGAPRDNIGSAIDQGSVRIMLRRGGQWGAQATLVASDGAAGDRFGTSVAIEGDTIVVGAAGDDALAPAGADSGSAYVFTRSGSMWTQQSKLTASDAAPGAAFGQAVGLSGDSVVVGAPQSPSAEGAAYVFTRAGTAWSQQARVVASDRAVGDSFGASVALVGDDLAVGSPLDDGAAGVDQGSVYVFGRSGGSWSQRQRLVASDAAAGDAFGSSVAMLDGLIAVGSPSDDIGASANQGSVSLFARSASTWIQQARLVAADGAAGDALGTSVALAVDMLVAGAAFDDVGASVDAGSSVVFTKTGASWSQQFRLVQPQVVPSSQAGCAVAASGFTVAVGGRGFTVGALADHGAAWSFDVPGACIPGVTNLATGTFSTTLAAAIASAQSGQRLDVSPASILNASLVDTLGRSLSIESRGGVRTLSGSIVTLGGASALLASPGEGIEVNGQVFSPAGATAQLVADRFMVGGRGGITARQNSSISIDALRSELHGSIRAESGASISATSSITEITGSVRIDASASLGFAGDVTSASAISASAESTIAANGLIDLQGTTSITNGLLSAPTILNRDRLELSGAVTIQGGTVNLRDFDVFGSSAIFGDFTNGTGAVTTIRSGTLFLFGSLANNGSIVGTLCSNCLGGPPAMEISGDLVLGPQASLQLPFVGSSVSLGGDFDCAIDSNERFDLALASLRFEGFGAEQTLEAMSADIGPSELGLDRTLAGSFPIGTLKIGPTPSVVRLVDAWDNDGGGQTSCEAIYVDQLEVAAGSRLVNAGCVKIYYRTLIADGTIDAPENLVPFTPPCVADFNQDGGVDGGDIDAFFAAWEAAEPSTDINQDGGIDGSDVVVFFDRWEAGC
ncbi:MAG: immunoglobulin domain-containing protein [Phycisphaerae bacterium]